VEDSDVLVYYLGCNCFGTLRNQSFQSLAVFEAKRIIRSIVMPDADLASATALRYRKSSLC